MHHTLSFAEVLSLSIRLLNVSANGLPEPVTNARRNAKRSARRRKSPRSKYDPRGKDPATLTEEAFVKARSKMPALWWSTLLTVLAQRFEKQHPELIRWKGFRLLTLDGTTITLPQKPRLTEHFRTSGNGKSRTTQARMVMLQFPFARLPWRYELCSIREAEQPIAQRLLQDMRRDDLVLMDRGFFSYGIFCQLQKQGAFFGIRRP